MGGIASIIASLFGLFWFFAARSMMSGFSGVGGWDFGPAAFFPFFGLLFVVMGVANAIYNFRNATAQNRHSVIDITDGEDEPDPLDPRFRSLASREDPLSGTWDDTQAGTRDDSQAGSWSGLRPEPRPGSQAGSGGTDRVEAESYCPYCGRPVDDEFDFCPGCGRKLPDSVFRR
jgi:hypothetical protein